LDTSELFFDQWELVRALVFGIVPELAQGRMFHQFFFGSSAILSNPVALLHFRYEVPTFFLRRIIMKYFLCLQFEEQRKFATLVAPHPQISWIFFEQMAINSLKLLETAQDFHLCGVSEAVQLGPGLCIHSFLFIPEMFNAQTPFFPVHNRIYKGSSSFDAFVYIETDNRSVIFLQMTIAQCHSRRYQLSSHPGYHPTLWQ
jgi:hypothetical protein